VSTTAVRIEQRNILSKKAGYYGSFKIEQRNIRLKKSKPSVKAKALGTNGYEKGMNTEGFDTRIDCCCKPRSSIGSCKALSKCHATN